MGTIAELLGFDLSDPTPPEGADDTTADEGDAPAGAGSGTAVAAPGSEVGGAPASDEAVLAAVLAETSLEPTAAREDLTLVGDLDLDTIGRYAVITSVEHELGVQFRDAEIDSLETLGDLLTAARLATGA